nr:transposase [Paenibacillus piri]
MFSVPGSAATTFDKFHVIQAANEAMDEVRRKERKRSALLKDIRYLWLNKRRGGRKTGQTLRASNRSASCSCTVNDCDSFFYHNVRLYLY